MTVYEGKSVHGGIVIGKIHILRNRKQQVKSVKTDDAEAELVRFEAAKKEAIRQVKVLYSKAQKRVGSDDAAIFEAHRMMLLDDNYNEAVENMIKKQGVSAEYAVASTGDSFARMFALMEDDYMRERAADVADISERLIFLLSGRTKADEIMREPVIIVAEDLAPSETVQLERKKVLSFVTMGGSLNSHTAILARTMAIPALVQTAMPLTEEMEGKLGIVDGTNGVFYIEPDEDTLFAMQKKQRDEEAQKELLGAVKGRESITADGQKILLFANIGNSRDLPAVLQNDADGIGLFRSEFLYLEKNDYPTEEEQFKIYKQVVRTMKGKRVVIRTLDIGDDKQCSYFGLEKEENPALGYRAIRICLTRTDVFKTQLRALFRASVFGKLAIMYPMISSVEEVKRIREIVEQVKAELTNEGIPYGEPEQGIMIETPAAAIISDMLAREVDFFSIGTNDLTQYTLAVDRQNIRLDKFYDPYHPAVMRMIETVIENAHRAGIRVGICGELGADMTLTKDFLAMGVDELSVSPGNILPIRRLILETDVGAYKKARAQGKGMSQ